MDFPEQISLGVGGALMDRSTVPPYKGTEKFTMLLSDSVRELIHTEDSALPEASQLPWSVPSQFTSTPDPVENLSGAQAALLSGAVALPAKTSRESQTDIDLPSIGADDVNFGSVSSTLSLEGRLAGGLLPEMRPKQISGGQTAFTSSVPGEGVEPLGSSAIASKQGGASNLSTEGSKNTPAFFQITQSLVLTEIAKSELGIKKNTPEFAFTQGAQNFKNPLSANLTRSNVVSDWRSNAGESLNVSMETGRLLEFSSSAVSKQIANEDVNSVDPKTLLAQKLGMTTGDSRHHTEVPFSIYKQEESSFLEAKVVQDFERPVATSKAFPVGSNVPTQQNGLTHQVIHHIRTGLAGDKAAEYEIRLDPEELGKLKMNVALRETGLVISVVAERQETIELLRRHASDLLNGLADTEFAGASLDFSQGKTFQGELIENLAQHEVTDEPSQPTTQTSVVLQYIDSDRLDIRL